MPSALPSQPGLLGRMVNALAGKLGSSDGQPQTMDRIARLGMSERQQDLNYLWGVYCCTQYEHRKLDWNGRECLDRMATDVIATQGYIPPGFVDASKQSAQAFPLKFRKPTAPYALVRMIVDRFTGLLFSEAQHPEIKVEGDAVTEDWLRSLADVARLWQQMILARMYGGAMGTVAVGFQFIRGKPVIEVHDPRWCFPEFEEHGSLELVSLEKRYRYQKEDRDLSTGRWEKKEYWYRRIIDRQTDTLFAPALVDQGEPDWQIARQVQHGFGFCPVVWVHNLPVQDSEDGDPDCSKPAYENAEAIDALLAQANRAILANCDPQLVINTKAEMSEVKMSGDNALRVPDGDAKFLEVQATGPKAALELVEVLRKHTLEMTQCVLEHPDIAGRTATEVERAYQSMLAKADVLREQYGTKCVLPLLEMIWRAAVYLDRPKMVAPEVAGAPAEPSAESPAAPSTVEEGAAPAGETMEGVMQPPSLVRSAVTLPPRYERSETGESVAIARQPGAGGTIKLKWPGYFQPTLSDVEVATRAAASGLLARVIDDETAVGFVAPYYKVEDKVSLLQKIRENTSQEQTALMSQMASAREPQPSRGFSFMDETEGESTTDNVLGA